MSFLVSDTADAMLRLFGQPSAQCDGKPLVFPEKGFALVALLAFAEGRELGRTAARELLWEAAPPDRRSGNLRQLLLRLARSHGARSPVVATADGRLRLATDIWRIDAVELLNAGPGARRAEDLELGILLEGIAVEGEAFEEWLAAARRTVEEKRGELLRLALDGAGADDARRAVLARKLIECDPLDEAAYRVLMSLHAQAGDRRGARRFWLECRNRLNEAMGIAPSVETRDLAVRLGLDGVAALPQTAKADMAGSADPIGMPTVVVLPPAIPPGSDLLEGLGFVVLEEITLGLSQFNAFRVIAAHTAWQLAQKAGDQGGVDAEQFDYAVTIGVKGAGAPLGGSCRLTRLSSGEVLWASAFEFGVEDLQYRLAELVRGTVAGLADAVERSETRISAPTQDASSYRLYLEGKRALGTTGLEALRAARKWFKAALRRSDDFSAPFAGLSRTLSMEWLVRGMTDPELLEDALVAAQRARERDPWNGRAMRELGFASLYLRRHEDSLAYFRDARLLAPHDADLLSDYADALMHDGQLEDARSVMATAKSLNPLAPDHYRWIEASILYRLEDFHGAIRILAPLSGSPAISRLLAASNAMAGDIASARRHAARVRESYPNFRVDQLWQILPDRRDGDTAQLARGLHLAGLE